MDRITFYLQGSAAEPYEIVIGRSDGVPFALCSCPAGENGQHCKHRVGILLGEAALCEGLNSDDVASARAWLPGTALEVALLEVVAQEALVAKAQADLKAAKKRLANAMLGRA